MASNGVCITPCTVILHCAVFGNLVHDVAEVAWYIDSYAQHEKAVWITWTEHRKKYQRKKRTATVVMRPDDCRYATIEADGQVIYDSRSDLPIDMAEWERTYAEHGGNYQKGGMQ